VAELIEKGLRRTSNALRLPLGALRIDIDAHSSLLRNLTDLNRELEPLIRPTVERKGDKLSRLGTVLTQKPIPIAQHNFKLEEVRYKV
jgi:hypothetical protein